MAGKIDVENQLQAPGILQSGELAKIDAKKPIKPLLEPVPRNLDTVTLAPLSQNPKPRKAAPLKKKKTIRAGPRREEEREDPD